MIDPSPVLSLTAPLKVLVFPPLAHFFFFPLIKQYSIMVKRLIAWIQIPSLPQTSGEAMGRPLSLSGLVSSSVNWG